MMKQRYLLLARQGKNQLWRYCLGAIFILIFMLYISPYLSVFITKLAIYVGILVPESDYSIYVYRNIKNSFYALTMFPVLRWLHQRPVSTIFSVEGVFSIKRLLVGTIACFTILFSPTFLGLTIDPTFSDNIGFHRWNWLPLIVLITIVQAAGEEFIFRGYLLQGLNLLTNNRPFAILFSSIAFAFIHFPNFDYVSTEAVKRFIFLTIFGIVCAVVTIKDNRIELAIGIHAGWNIVQVILEGLSPYMK